MVKRTCVECQCVIRHGKNVVDGKIYCEDCVPESRAVPLNKQKKIAREESTSSLDSETPISRKQKKIVRKEHDSTEDSEEHSDLDERIKKLSDQLVAEKLSEINYIIQLRNTVYENSIRTDKIEKELYTLMTERDAFSKQCV